MNDLNDTNQRAYEAEIASGDDYRIKRYDPSSAIQAYLRALEIGGDRDCYVMQMLGVCYHLLWGLGTAADWLDRALKIASDDERSGIYRDCAEVFRKAGNRAAAREAIDRSIGLISRDKDPINYAASLGFRARQARDDGNFVSALGDFIEADTLLAVGDNREVELYNKLHLTSTLSESGYWLAARQAAWRSLQLARTNGAPAHRLRALCLLLSGYRLEQWSQFLWRAFPK